MPPKVFEVFKLRNDKSFGKNAKKVCKKKLLMLLTLF